MFKKAMKTMGSLILVLTMLFSLSTAVLADTGAPDLTQKGSITITPKSTDASDTVVQGMSFTLYYVAHINTDAGLVYELEGVFAECGENISDLNAAGLSQVLADFVSGNQNRLTGIKADADENGEVKFEDLTPGLYLLIQNDTGTGYKVSPFLVPVPQKNEKEDNWIYEVEAVSKAEVEPTPTATPTPVPTGSAEPTPTPVPGEPTPTPTPVPTGSAEPTPTPVPGEPTATPTPEVVLSTTPEPTPEAVPSTTPEPTPEVVPSTTPELTPGVTPSVTPSGTPSVTPSVTPEVSGTPTPGISETPTPTPSGGSDSNPTPTPTQKLAQTGQLNWPIPVLAAAGIVLFGIGWALKNLNKREK